ncbi:MAG: hypothetical protein FWG66_13475 [Spirochaetes bacterium]|nr:hypothetical protein [Spirochaetota bacterium]
MKKIAFIIAFATISSTAAFAVHPDGWGVGIVGRGAWGYGRGGLGGAALSLKAPAVPIFWGMALDFGGNYFGFSVTGDHHIAGGMLTDPGGPMLGWYLGLGGFVNFTTFNPTFGSWTSFSFGGRLPIGLTLQIPAGSVAFEVFAAFVPNLGFGFWFWNSRYNDYWRAQDRSRLGLVGGFGGELGVRLWL